MSILKVEEEEFLPSKEELAAEKDCMFVTADETMLPCHKSLLKRHSDVMKTMLESDFLERDGKISAKEFDRDVISSFLELLYHGKTTLNRIYLVKLLHFVHMYQIETLVEACERVIMHKILDECSAEYLSHRPHLSIAAIGRYL